MLYKAATRDGKAPSFISVASNNEEETGCGD